MKAISDSDATAIAAAVGMAEKRTAGEIVPMIVRQSTYVRHVPVIVGLLSFIVFVLLLPGLYWILPGPIWLWDLAALVVSVLLSVSLSRVPFVQRLLTSRKDSTAAVMHRAELEFLETGIPATEGRTGVLIFVSSFERRAVILGDKAISDRMKPEAWTEILEAMITELRAGRMKEAFEGAISRVGDVLAREFPIQPGDTNELPNTLIVKD